MTDPRSIVCVMALWCLSACQAPEQTGDQATAQTFVGRETCGSCHAQAFVDWSRSRDAEAKHIASTETVRGNFADARFEHESV